MRSYVFTESLKNTFSNIIQTLLSVYMIKLNKSLQRNNQLSSLIDR